MDLITRHRTDRGLGLPQASKGRRRPRTVYLTVEGPKQMRMADVIWHIRPDNQEIDMVDPGTVTHIEAVAPVAQTQQGSAHSSDPTARDQTSNGAAVDQQRPQFLPEQNEWRKQGRTTCLLSGDQFPFAAKQCMP